MQQGDVIATGDGRQHWVVGLTPNGPRTVDLGAPPGPHSATLSVPMPEPFQGVVQIAGPGEERVGVWPPRRSVVRDDEGPENPRLLLGMLWPDLQMQLRKGRVYAVDAPWTDLAERQRSMGRTIIVAGHRHAVWHRVSPEWVVVWGETDGAAALTPFAAVSLGLRAAATGRDVVVVLPNAQVWRHAVARQPELGSFPTLWEWFVGEAGRVGRGSVTLFVCGVGRAPGIDHRLALTPLYLGRAPVLGTFCRPVRKLEAMGRLGHAMFRAAQMTTDAARVQQWLCADAQPGRYLDPLVALLVFLALLKLDLDTKTGLALRGPLANAIQAKPTWLEGLRSARRIEKASLAELFALATTVSQDVPAC
ncbi:MAG: hypothetical protein AAGA48_35290 [Myxococcota bacterium]